MKHCIKVLVISFLLSITIKNSHAQQDCNKFGAWLWFIDIVSVHDTHEKLATHLENLGVKRIYIKVADGTVDFSMWPELTDEEVVNTYKSHGLEVWAWSYNYPRDYEGHEQKQAEALYYAAKTGYEGYVLDIEIEFDGKQKKLEDLLVAFTNARDSAINDGYASQDFSLYCTTWGNPKVHNMHVDIIDQYVDAHMPQTYIEAWGDLSDPAGEVQASIDEYIDEGCQKPIYPIVSSEGKMSTMSADVTNEFMQAVGVEASFWSIPHTWMDNQNDQAGLWEIFDNTDWTMNYCPTNQPFIAKKVQTLENNETAEIKFQTADTMGNVFAAINWSGTLSIGTSELSSSAAGDGLAVKYDKALNPLWFKQINSAGIQQIALDKNNNVMVAGTKTVNPQNNETRFFMAKYSGSGELLWEKTASAGTCSRPVSIDVSETGSIYVHGGFKHTLTIDNSTINYQEGEEARFVARFLPDGDLSWLQRQIPAHVNSLLTTNDLAVFDNHLYISGNFSERFAVDDISVSAPVDTAAFILKLDTLGNAQSINVISGEGDEVLRSLIADNSGLYIAADFNGTMAIGTTEAVCENELSAYWLKLNHTGDVGFMLPMSASQFVSIENVDKNANGTFYLSGKTGEGTLSIGDNICEVDRNTGFIAQCQADGTVDWLKIFDEPNFDLRTMAAGNDEIYISGEAAGDGKLDCRNYQISNAGQYIFATLINHVLPVVELPDDNISTCGAVKLNAGSWYNQYNWNDGLADTQYLRITESGEYHVTVTDDIGCHASDTVQITVFPNPEVDLGDNQTIYNTETTTLEVSGSFASFLWNDGSNGASLTIDGAETPLGKNDFWVKATDQNGCVAYDKVKVTIEDFYAGINGQEAEHDFTIMPNPSNGIFSIRFAKSPQPDDVVKITDIQGKTVFYQNALDLNNTITILDVGKGVYIVQYLTKNKIIVKKVVVR